MRLTSLISRTQQEQGALAVFRWQEGYVMVTMVTKTWFKIEFKTGF